LAKDYQQYNVNFVEVPLTPQTKVLHDALGVPSLPWTHIYHPVKCKHWTLVPLHSAHALKGYEKGDDVIIPRTNSETCLVRCQNCVG
jgi:hypothetical protein